MKPTLFLLAAGMGSRYGGLKQLDGLGPNGETIMDYSIYDAINAGFGKLVFVIRKDFEQDFRDKIISKYEGHIPCELVFQSIDDLPEGFTCPEGRTKPWGTNHAVMMGAASGSGLETCFGICLISPSSLSEITTVLASVSTEVSFTKSPCGSIRECFRSAITSSIFW